MSSVYERLRDPAYTGERRCWPCTLVNVVLLVAVCAVLLLLSPLIAGVLAIGGAIVIALRGYLVPYTPEFAPRLVGWLPGDPFHAGSAGGAGDAADAPRASGSFAAEESGDADHADAQAADDQSGEAVLAGLVEAGVVVPDGEALFLDDEFREAWRDEIESLGEGSDEAVADALADAAPWDAVVDVVEPRDERWFVVSDGSDDPANEAWFRPPVALAEAAAVRTLADRTDLDEMTVARAADPLRTFIEECPDCGGRVEETTTVECCGGRGTEDDPVDEVLACEECEARLYTFE